MILSLIKKHTITVLIALLIALATAVGIFNQKLKAMTTQHEKVQTDYSESLRKISALERISSDKAKQIEQNQQEQKRLVETFQQRHKKIEYILASKPTHKNWANQRLPDDIARLLKHTDTFTSHDHNALPNPKPL